VKGFERGYSMEEASRVPDVRPLEPVVLDMLLDRPWVSPLEEADGRGRDAFLRSLLFPEVDDDARCPLEAALAASAAALVLSVWFAACL
jgi:hypothetical protein